MRDWRIEGSRGNLIGVWQLWDLLMWIALPDLVEGWQQSDSHRSATSDFATPTSSCPEFGFSFIQLPGWEGGEEDSK
jgi:hypothetical protein